MYCKPVDGEEEEASKTILDPLQKLVAPLIWGIGLGIKVPETVEKLLHAPVLTSTVYGPALAELKFAEQFWNEKYEIKKFNSYHSFD